MFGGYGGRISLQVGGNINAVGALMMSGSDLGATADSATWPQAVDRFFNQAAYLTDAEKAKQAGAAAEWAAYYRKLQNAASSPEAVAQRQHVGRNKAKQGQAADPGTPVAIG
jgi:hypothetical protein